MRYLSSMPMNDGNYQTKNLEKQLKNAQNIFNNQNKDLKNRLNDEQKEKKNMKKKLDDMKKQLNQLKKKQELDKGNKSQPPVNVKQLQN